MSRTNIDIDDELIGRVMARYELRTKREAVELALRTLADRARLQHLDADFDVLARHTSLPVEPVQA